MINLGSYSGKGAPEVRFRPMVIDRSLEGVALLVVLATWVGIGCLYVQTDGRLSSYVWAMGGCSVFCFLLMWITSYVPVRFINFPVRVNERNVGIQYLLAVRLVRVMNIIVCLMLLACSFLEHCEFSKYLLMLSWLLLALALLGYYVLAFKYK